MESQAHWRSALMQIAFITSIMFAEPQPLTAAAENISSVCKQHGQENFAQVVCPLKFPKAACWMGEEKPINHSISWRSTPALVHNMHCYALLCIAMLCYAIGTTRAIFLWHFATAQLSSSSERILLRFYLQCSSTSALFPAHLFEGRNTRRLYDIVCIICMYMFFLCVMCVCVYIVCMYLSCLFRRVDMHGIVLYGKVRYAKVP